MNGVIQAVQEPEILLTSNTASLPFSIVDLRTRSAINCNGWMNHNEGSALFSIIEGGIYEVTFNANVTSATAGVVRTCIICRWCTNNRNRNGYTSCNSRRIFKYWI